MNTASGVLFRDSLDRVLLVKPSYKPYWDLPGGQIEPGESPKQAAAREIKEELGLTVDVGRLLVVDYLPPRRGRGLPEMLAFVFDAGPIDRTAIAIDGVEIQAWDWFNDVQRAQAQLHAPILQRRVTVALSAAVQHHHTRMLESGWPA
jgi:8-oxo-dGTP diphosphatase